MFRKKALDHISSPDELDHMLVIIKSRNRITMMTLFGLCIAGLIWAILGSLPITVKGFGVLINPGNVKSLQAKTSGMLIELPIRPGQKLKKGDTIAVIYQPELEQKLDQAQNKLKRLSEIRETTLTLEDKKLALELESLEKQRNFLLVEIKKAKKIGADLTTQTEKYNRSQRDNLQKTKELSSRLNEALKDRHKAANSLNEEGLVSTDNVLHSKTQLVNSELKLADIEVQMQELKLSELEAKNNQLKLQNRISDLNLRLMELNIRKQQLEAEQVKSDFENQNRVNDAKDTLNQLTLLLEEQKYIKSAYPGTIIEISSSIGQFLKPGAIVAKIELDSPNGKLQALSYFPIKDGKKIQSGMRIQVTPTIVERERYGSIIGDVVSVSGYPISFDAAKNIVGSDQMARVLTGEGMMIEVVSELKQKENPSSGYVWTSMGPSLKLTAGTTTTNRVTVENRAPITYILPFLRSILTGEGSDG